MITANGCLVWYSCLFFTWNINVCLISIRRTRYSQFSVWALLHQNIKHSPQPHRLAALSLWKHSSCIVWPLLNFDDMLPPNIVSLDSAYIPQWNGKVFTTIHYPVTIAGFEFSSVVISDWLIWFTEVFAWYENGILHDFVNSIPCSIKA